MNDRDIIRFRLANQQVAETKFKSAVEVLIWFGAMQAQVFHMAKWALGLRLKGVTESSIENSFNEGKILRTHLLRPTWHFVAPQDIRWMLGLTAPRVHAVNKYYYKKFELDKNVLMSANAVLVKMLRDGKTITRTALAQSLRRAKIKAEGLRLGYIFMQAELEGIICSGPRDGKQFTYALLEERVPPVKPMLIEESLAELSKRYFTSRGPATLQDFIWWSGLAARQAKEGVALLGDNFIQEKVGTKDFILNADAAVGRKSPTAFLMPDYDEYGISYKDRSVLFKKAKENGNLKGLTPYSHMLMVDGVLSGTWSFTNSKSTAFEVKPFTPTTPSNQKAIGQAVRRLESFLASDR